MNYVAATWNSKALKQIIIAYTSKYEPNLQLGYSFYFRNQLEVLFMWI